MNFFIVEEAIYNGGIRALIMGNYLPVITSSHDRKRR